MHSLFFSLATLASLITTPTVHVSATTLSPSSDFRPSHILFHLLLDQDTTQYNLLTQLNHPLLEPFTSIGSNTYEEQFNRYSYNHDNNNNNINSTESSNYVIINLTPSYLDVSEQSFFGLETFDESGTIRTCVIGISMNEYDKQIHIDTVVQNGLTCYIPQRTSLFHDNDNNDNVELKSLLYHLPLSVVLDDSMNSYCHWNEAVKSCVPNWYGREDEIVEEIEEDEEERDLLTQEEHEEVETEQRPSAGKSEAQSEGQKYSEDTAESDSASFTAQHTKAGHLPSKQTAPPQVTRTNARATIAQPQRGSAVKAHNAAKSGKPGVVKRCFQAVCDTVKEDIKNAGGPGKVIGHVTGGVLGGLAGAPAGHVGVALGTCAGGYVGGKVGHCVEKGINHLRHKGK